MDPTTVNGSDSWLNKAYCRDVVDPDIFFPSENDKAGAARVIKQYCNKCPVVTSCLEAGMSLAKYGLGEIQGVWGGMPAGEVRRIRRQLNPVRVLKCGTRYAYDMGCRCEECRRAKMDYQRPYEQRRKEAR